MKTIYKVLLSVSVAAVCWSCSKDYLDTNPSSSTSAATIFENTENAKLAVNGIARIMTSQHLSTQGFCGEGTIKYMFGEFPGENYFHYLLMNLYNSDNAKNDSLYAPDDANLLQPTHDDATDDYNILPNNRPNIHHASKENANLHNTMMEPNSILYSNKDRKYSNSNANPTITDCYM